LIVASFGYLLDSFAQLLLLNYASYETIFLIIVAVPGIIGEMSLCFWLLFKGGKNQLPERISPQLSLSPTDVLK
jgi:hypothetical protein